MTIAGVQLAPYTVGLVTYIVDFVTYIVDLTIRAFHLAGQCGIPALIGSKKWKPPGETNAEEQSRFG